MVGGEGRTVKAVAPYDVARRCLWVAVLLAACGGSYARQMNVHVALLTDVARKGVDLVATGHLTAESMPELTYPLERAQAFAAAETRRHRETPPPSLAAFDTLVARYREFVDGLDRVRREKTGDAARAALAPSLAAVEASADAVRVALRREAAT
jgi:hypothetical protein